MAQQLHEATPFEQKPQYSICDNDKKHGDGFARSPKASGINVIHTPHVAPQANAIGERLVGSLRRECLDHRLVLGVLPLMWILKEYVAYFNCARPHQGIGQRIPEAMQSPPGKPNAGKVTAFPQTGKVITSPKAGTVIAIPVLNGLHHNYDWAA